MLAIALLVGQYFESPSTGVTAVLEHRYDKPDDDGIVWGLHGQSFDDEDRRRRGVAADLDISDRLIAPALLKTRRIFSDNKIAQRQRNLKSGRVDKKALGKRAWGEDERLFGKKRLPKRKDYAVLISMDISSSNFMGGNLALLKRSVMAQAELMSRVGVKFAIIAHSAAGDEATEGGSWAMHVTWVKDWDEPWSTQAKQNMENLAAVGGNLDGHAMEFMRKSLRARPETDKVLLYYTDGQFPAANADEELDVLQRQLQLVKRDQITLLGVGIRTNSPVEHGLDTVEVHGDDDLPAVIDHLGKRLGSTAR